MDGKLYLKFTDTQNDLLPVTALSFGDLIEKLAHAPGIERINVVLDSCQSSGLLHDLSSLLSERAKQSFGNTSIAILAAASKEQSAKSTIQGGYLTVELERLLEGTTTAQRWCPFIDLSQAAEAVKRVAKVAEQKPSYWMINLHSPSPIAPNPRYDPSLGAVAAPGTFFSDTVKLSDEQHAAIRKFLSVVDADGMSPAPISILRTALDELPEAQQLAVYLSLSEAIDRQQISGLLPIKAGGIFLVQASQNICQTQSIRLVVDFHLKRYFNELQELIVSFFSEIAKDRYHFLRGGEISFSSLFYLPIDIADLIGWTGLILRFGAMTEEESGIVRLGLKTLLEEYGQNFLLLDDRQAPGLLQFYLGARKTDWTDEIEEVLGLYFHDIWSHGGKVANDDLSARERVNFIISRDSPWEDDRNLLQQPSEAIAVILLCGALSGLDDFWDGLLRALDHTAINFFLPHDLSKFAEERIADGKNVTLRVGEDVWSLEDLRRVCIMLAGQLQTRHSVLAKQADVLSLAFQDRTSWTSLLDEVDRGLIAPILPFRRISALSNVDGGMELLLTSGSK